MTAVIKYQLNLEKYKWSRAALEIGCGSTHWATMRPMWRVFGILSYVLDILKFENPQETVMVLWGQIPQRAYLRGKGIVPWAVGMSVDPSTSGGESTVNCSEQLRVSLMLFLMSFRSRCLYKPVDALGSGRTLSELSFSTAWGGLQGGDVSWSAKSTRQKGEITNDTLQTRCTVLLHGNSC